MGRSRGKVWLMVSIALIWLAPAFGDDSPLQIDYNNSSISIHGKAAGLFPATFRFETFEANLNFSDDGSQLEAASFDFSYAEITSGSRSKDRKIREWLETDMYPNGNFTHQRIEVENEETFAVGQLRLHGESHPARFRYTITKIGSQFAFRARAVIDYHDWKLPDLWVFAFKIKNELEIVIDIVGPLPLVSEMAVK